MKQVISVRDLEEMLREGRDVRVLPEDALLTPSARDFLRDLDGVSSARPAAGQSTKSTGASRSVTSQSTKNDIEAFFTSPQVHDFKLQLSDIGRGLWHRA